MDCRAAAMRGARLLYFGQPGDAPFDMSLDTILGGRA